MNEVLDTPNTNDLNAVINKSVIGEPHKSDRLILDYDNLTYDTYENIRRKYVVRYFKEILNSLDKLLNAVKEDNAPQEKKSYIDERLWKPELDKSGNGYAVIRFFYHQRVRLTLGKSLESCVSSPTGQWYIENSLTTIGQKDPVSEYNSKLWNSGVESDKEIARKQKRKLQYFSNILVVVTKTQKMRAKSISV